MSDFAKYVVKLLGKGRPLWASVNLSHFILHPTDNVALISLRIQGSEFGKINVHNFSSFIS